MQLQQSVPVDDDIVFPEDGETSTVSSTEPPWVVLVVDDDPEVHEVTRLGLTGFEFESRPLLFLHAYSATEAERILEERSDIAVMLLDVVMETETAGLDLAARIRERLSNHRTRIVIRTGQASTLTEVEVLRLYDVNDYRVKNDLTLHKLVSALLIALRGYRDILNYSG